MKRVPLPLFISALALCVNLTGCFSNGASAGEGVSFSTIVEGTHSGITSQRFEVIRDPSTFTGMWLAFTSNIPVVPEMPLLEFSQDQVIAVFLGQEGTGGYRIQITSMEEQENEVVVNVQVTTPGAKCIVSQATTEPYHIVSFPKIYKIVEFDTNVVKKDCSPP